MTTRAPTARTELADRVPRSERPLADERLADSSRSVQAATVRVLAAFDGSPAGNEALALAALLARSQGSKLPVCAFPTESLAGHSVRIASDPRGQWRSPHLRAPGRGRGARRSPRDAARPPRCNVSRAELRVRPARTASAGSLGDGRPARPRLNPSRAARAAVSPQPGSRSLAKSTMRRHRRVT